LAGTDKGLVEPLFGSKHNFAKGTSVALSSAEKKALSGCSTDVNYILLIDYLIHFILIFLISTATTILNNNNNNIMYFK